MRHRPRGPVARVTIAVLATAAALLGSGFAAAPASAAPPPDGWSCRGQVLELNRVVGLPLEPLTDPIESLLTAGSDDARCADDGTPLDDTLLTPVKNLLAPLGIGLGAVTATTTVDDATKPSREQTVRARTKVVDLRLGLQATLLGLPINQESLLTVEAIESSVTGRCTAGAPSYDSSYDVSGVTILGSPEIVDLTSTLERVALDLGLLQVLVKLSPGEAPTTANGATKRGLRVQVIQRALGADTSLIDVVIGESKVQAGGLACAPAPAPTVDAPVVADGSRAITAGVTPPAGASIASCSFSVTPAGGAARTVAGVFSPQRGRCEGTLPFGDVPPGDYTATATAATGGSDPGTATSLPGSFDLVGLTVGDPGISGRRISVPATPGDGATIASCAITFGKDDGPRTPLTATYDDATDACVATLPAGRFPAGDHVATATVTDTNGQSVTKTKTLTTGGPTITDPALTGRTVSATVAPGASGDPVETCSFEVTRTGGAPKTVTGSITGGVCSANLPRAAFPAGDYTFVVTATDAGGSVAQAPGAGKIVGPTVGAPVLTGRELEIPATPGSGATLPADACTVVLEPATGPAVPLTSTFAGGSCKATLPSDVQPGVYTVDTAVTDSDGGTGSGTGQVTLHGPTVGVPVLTGRTVEADVTPESGTTIKRCSFDVTRTGGATATVPGTFAAGVCTASLPFPDYPAGDYAIVAKATDSADFSTTRSGTGTIADPATLTVGEPSIAGREVGAAITVPAGASVQSCTITVTPEGGGPARSPAATFADGRCTTTLPKSEYPAGSRYDVVVAAVDSLGRTASEDGPITIPAVTVGNPTATGREVGAAVTTPAGTSAESCEIAVTPAAGGATKTVDGTLAGGRCTATLPRAEFPLGEYDVVVTVTDGEGNTPNSSGKVTISAGPAVTVGTPVLDGREVKTPVTVPAGTTVTGCTVSVAPKGGGAAIEVPGTFKDGVCTATLPREQFPPGEYGVVVTVTDGEGRTATGDGPVAIAGPTVGTPIAVGPIVSVPVTPGAGATIRSCTLVITPAGGGAARTVEGSYDALTGTCNAVLPQDQYPSGDYDVKATVVDSNGDQATKTGRVTVSQFAPPSVAPPTPPTAGDVAQSLLACEGGRISLIDTRIVGSRVRISGVALPSMASRTVLIRLSSKGRSLRTVARTKVAKDGRFTTTAPRPAKAILKTTARAKYVAVIDRTRSDALRLTRRTILTSVTTSGGRITVKGRLTAPYPKAGQRVTIGRRVSCTSYSTVARGRTTKTGRFSVSFKATKGAAALYRVDTRVPSKPGEAARSRTFSLPQIVTAR